MNKTNRLWVAILSCLMIVSCTELRRKQRSEKTSDTLEVPKDTSDSSIPEYVSRIIVSYPDFKITYLENKLVFEDGFAIICDDGKNKSFAEKLDDCDIEDMFIMSYDVKSPKPAFLNDCGRGRNDALFKKMYGSSEAEVRKNLVTVSWFGQKIPFTKVNGAAEQLKKVCAELLKYPCLHKYLTNASSFYWRKVRGADRQSAHSYGIAIDINTLYSNYWLWANPKSSETDKIEYENKIPLEIVKVFEKYGFIWGGRWYHYDTMHFEYRPELRVQVITNDKIIK